MSDNTPTRPTRPSLAALGNGLQNPEAPVKNGGETGIPARQKLIQRQPSISDKRTSKRAADTQEQREAKKVKVTENARLRATSSYTREADSAFVKGEQAPALAEAERIAADACNLDLHPLPPAKSPPLNGEQSEAFCNRPNLVNRSSNASFSSLETSSTQASGLSNTLPPGNTPAPVGVARTDGQKLLIPGGQAYVMGGKTLFGFIDSNGNFNWTAFLEKLREDGMAHFMWLLIMEQGIETAMFIAQTVAMVTKADLVQGSTYMNRLQTAMDETQTLAQYDILRGNAALERIASYEILTPQDQLSVMKAQEKTQSRGPATDQLRNDTISRMSGEETTDVSPTEAAKEELRKNEGLSMYVLEEHDLKNFQDWAKQHKDNPAKLILVSGIPGNDNKLDLTLLSDREVKILQEMDTKYGTDYAKRYKRMESHLRAKRHNDQPGLLGVLKREREIRLAAANKADAHADKLKEQGASNTEITWAQKYAQLLRKDANSFEHNIEVQNTLCESLFNHIQERPGKFNNLMFLRLKEYCDQLHSWSETIKDRCAAKTEADTKKVVLDQRQKACIDSRNIEVQGQLCQFAKQRKERFKTGECQEPFDGMIEQFHDIEKVGQELAARAKREDLSDSLRREMADNELDKKFYNIMIRKAKATGPEHLIQAAIIWHRWNETTNHRTLLDDIKAGKYPHVNAKIMERHARTLSDYLNKQIKAANNMPDSKEKTKRVEELTVLQKKHEGAFKFWTSEDKVREHVTWPSSNLHTHPDAMGEFEFKNVDETIDWADPRQEQRFYEAEAKGGGLGLKTYHDWSGEGTWFNLSVWNNVMSHLQQAFMTIQQSTEGDPQNASMNAATLADEVRAQAKNALPSVYDRVKPMLDRMVASNFKPANW